MSLYLGDTPIASTGYDKANTDLSNLTNTGKNIANWSNNVTNCITEIPQDINLELNDGTLTLKAGSKLYYPDGLDSNNNPKFTTRITTEDYVANGQYGYDATPHILCLNNADYWIMPDLSIVFSGTTAPTGSQYMLWYDTANNIVKWTSDSGSTWSVQDCSLPFGIATYNGGSYENGFKQIDQVFNGFGYIGSTVFAIPGVKGLIPNGRNEDGSLKSIEFTIDSVKTVTRTWVDGNSGQVWGYIKNPPTGAAETWYWNRYIESDEEPADNDYTMWYKPSENITYMNNGAQSSTHNWEKVNYINFGKASGINSQEIKIFTPKTVFHALDYNDSSIISGWSMPSSRYIDLTFGASGTEYIAPANGWFYFGIAVGASGNWINCERDGIFLYSANATNASQSLCQGVPARVGSKIKLNYFVSGNGNKYIKFFYAVGEN